MRDFTSYKPNDKTGSKDAYDMLKNFASKYEGASKSDLISAIKKEAEKRKERFKDDLASRDPISKQRREQEKARKQRQAERNEILQAKGKTKVYKILKKIGNDLMNPVVIDGPTGPKRQPWDEKPDPDYRGGRI